MAFIWRAFDSARLGSESNYIISARQKLSSAASPAVDTRANRSGSNLGASLSGTCDLG
jgi:hypothetical protein